MDGWRIRIVSDLAVHVLQTVSLQHCDIWLAASSDQKHYFDFAIALNKR